MSTLISQDNGVDCPYHFIEDEVPLTEVNIVLTLSRYLDNVEQLSKRRDVAVFLDSDQEVVDIANYLEKIPLILLNFPHFTDGRAYSKAVQLKQEFGFEGEIRASGDVRKDQLLEMHRCGFDSFILDSDKENNPLQKVSGTFSHQYQASVINSKPLFRIRSVN